MTRSFPPEPTVSGGEEAGTVMKCSQKQMWNRNGDRFNGGELCDVAAYGQSILPDSGLRQLL